MQTIKHGFVLLAIQPVSNVLEMLTTVLNVHLNFTLVPILILVLLTALNQDNTKIILPLLAHSVTLVVITVLDLLPIIVLLAIPHSILIQIWTLVIQLPVVMELTLRSITLILIIFVTLFVLTIHMETLHWWMDNLKILAFQLVLHNIMLIQHKNYVCFVTLLVPFVMDLQIPIVKLVYLHIS